MLAYVSTHNPKIGTVITKDFIVQSTTENEKKYILRKHISKITIQKSQQKSYEQVLKLGVDPNWIKENPAPELKLNKLEEFDTFLMAVIIAIGLPVMAMLISKSILALFFLCLIMLSFIMFITFNRSSKRKKHKIDFKNWQTESKKFEIEKKEQVTVPPSLKIEFYNEHNSVVGSITIGIKSDEELEVEEQRLLKEFNLPVDKPRSLAYTESDSN